MSSNPAWRFRLWLLATAGYWVAMAVVMHVPLEQREVTPGWIDVPHLDKIVHAGLYATLSFLLTKTLLAGGVRRSGRTTFAVAAAYGLLDELTQPLTGRNCDPWDYATDLFGIAIGIFAASAFSRGARPRAFHASRGDEPRG